ncbi:hypothetical protein EW146_g983 [Bondarzewia mesenterica]|uniref:Peptidase A1 domain-containing protein n=1 Tax=Bondarzewia mesenterica TaxID=1095465 RepID=A0A4S4M5C5_9AGAM|nr:hypothetical protein EW146_g983 [Bondarzewia mesenterica]
MARLATSAIPLKHVAQLVCGSYQVPLQLSIRSGYIDIHCTSIGGQELQVILDTGSSDLWVVSEDCRGPDCTGVSKYSKTASLRISSSEFKLDYLVGTVSGTIGFETVTFGSYQVTSQVFAMANETHNLDLSSAENSGILGLSFPLVASITATTGKTLLENLFSYFDDSHRYFAFKLGREMDDSSFTLGKIDTALANSMDDFTYTPVYSGKDSRFDYWKLPLQAITLNSPASFTSLSPSRVSGSPTPIAVFDTGTTFILGPTIDVDALWIAAGASRKTDAGQWQVQCNRAVSVGFVLGDGASQKEYIVDPIDINRRGRDVDDWCVCAELPCERCDFEINSGDWILGDAFLRNVYVVHQGATSHRSPLIGLLNMTDPTSSLKKFQQERGDDPTSSTRGSSTFGAHSRPHAVFNTGAICGFVALGAFVTGGLGALFIQQYNWYIKRRRSVQKWENVILFVDVNGKVNAKSTWGGWGNKRAGNQAGRDPAPAPMGSTGLGQKKGVDSLGPLPEVPIWTEDIHTCDERMGMRGMKHSSNQVRDLAERTDAGRDDNMLSWAQQAGTPAREAPLRCTHRYGNGGINEGSGLHQV